MSSTNAKDLYKLVRFRHPNVPVRTNAAFRAAVKDCLMILLNLEESSMSEFQQEKMTKYLNYFCSWVPQKLRKKSFGSSTFNHNFFKKTICFDEPAQEPMEVVDAAVVEPIEEPIDVPVVVPVVPEPLPGPSAAIEPVEDVIAVTDPPFEDVVVVTEASDVPNIAENPGESGPTPSKRRKSFEEKSRWQQNREINKLAEENETKKLLKASVRRLENEGDLGAAFAIKKILTDTKRVGDKLKEFLLMKDFDDMPDEEISPIRLAKVL